MPELPDVEIFGRFLDRTAIRRTIENVQVRDEWILRGSSARKFRSHVIGKKFAGTRRHGKYLFAALTGKGFIVFHFGMTGFFRSFTTREIEPQYNRVVFSLDNGVRVAFNCRRRLGSVLYVEDPEQFIADRNLGPDVLCVDLRCFLGRLNGTKRHLKCVLMDQSVLAGIGNIYADEILFHARLHPRTPVAATTYGQRRILFDSIVRVLNTAIQKNTDASRFPRTYLTRNRYRFGLCPRCQTPLSTLRLCGRTAYLCPKEQRLNT
jgi:formamidopyrimidine-DNA glycosylase